MAGYENTSGLNVNNHYGARSTGGTQGVERTSGAGNEATINFDGDALDFFVEVPAGAVVTEVVDDFATGAIATAVVGAVNIAAADGAAANYVAVPLGGTLTVTGPTAGSVIVKYLNVA